MLEICFLHKSGHQSKIVKAMMENSSFVSRSEKKAREGSNSISSERSSDDVSEDEPVSGAEFTGIVKTLIVACVDYIKMFIAIATKSEWTLVVGYLVNFLAAFVCFLAVALGKPAPQQAMDALDASLSLSLLMSVGLFLWRLWGGREFRAREETWCSFWRRSTVTYVWLLSFVVATGYIWFGWLFGVPYLTDFNNRRGFLFIVYGALLILIIYEVLWKLLPSPPRPPSGPKKLALLFCVLLHCIFAILFLNAERREFDDTSRHDDPMRWDVFYKFVYVDAGLICGDVLWLLVMILKVTITLSSNQLPANSTTENADIAERGNEEEGIPPEQNDIEEGVVVEKNNSGHIEHVERDIEKNEEEDEIVEEHKREEADMLEEEQVNEAEDIFEESKEAIMIEKSDEEEEEDIHENNEDIERV